MNKVIIVHNYTDLFMQILRLICSFTENCLSTSFISIFSNYDAVFKKENCFKKKNAYMYLLQFLLTGQCKRTIYKTVALTLVFDI